MVVCMGGVGTSFANHHFVSAEVRTAVYVSVDTNRSAAVAAYQGLSAYLPPERSRYDFQIR
jgi:hypothetical protein